MLEKISAGISTFDPLSEKGDLLVDFVEEFLERLGQPLKYKLSYVAEGKRIRPKDTAFTDANWKKTREKLKNGEIYSLWLVHCDDRLRNTPVEGPIGLQLNIEDYQELYETPLIYFWISKLYFGDHIPLEFQQVCVDLLDKLTLGLNSTGGLITLDKAAGAYCSAHESYIGFEYVRDSMKLKDYFRGYQWGNYLSPIHVISLGGPERVEKEAPVYLTKRFADGGMYLQLTEDIEQVSDDDLRRLKNYFKPILIPKTEDQYHLCYANMRVIEDE